jgi:hypothetical protein
MLDAYFPTDGGPWLILSRYTQPKKDHRLLLEQLGLQLPAKAQHGFLPKEGETF